MTGLVYLLVAVSLAAVGVTAICISIQRARAVLGWLCEDHEPQDSEEDRGHGWGDSA